MASHTNKATSRVFISILLIAYIGLIVSNYSSRLVESTPNEVLGKNSDQHQSRKDYYETIGQGAHIPPSALMGAGMIERLLESLPGKHLGKYIGVEAIDNLDIHDQHSIKGNNNNILSEGRQCYVEVQKVELKPGKCTKLGANDMPFCLTQDHIALDLEACS